MREILFRGRRSYDQEWIEGSLIKDDRGESHIARFKDVEECGHHLRFDGDEPMFFDQETIGQLTGLTDKNGTKIFEGDKCILIGGENDIQFTIEFIDIAFMMVFGENDTDYLGGYTSEYIEVIGNIHNHCL